MTLDQVAFVFYSVNAKQVPFAPSKKAYRAMAPNIVTKAQNSNDLMPVIGIPYTL